VPVQVCFIIVFESQSIAEGDGHLGVSLGVDTGYGEVKPKYSLDLVLLTDRRVRMISSKDEVKEFVQERDSSWRDGCQAENAIFLSVIKPGDGADLSIRREYLEAHGSVRPRATLGRSFQSKGLRTDNHIRERSGRVGVACDCG
jgi:hypothetical protein